MLPCSWKLAVGGGGLGAYSVFEASGVKKQVC